jgi:hypothetical protein
MIKWRLYKWHRNLHRHGKLTGIRFITAWSKLDARFKAVINEKA